ncbi:MAG: ketoacyl-ACP synthase III [Bacteroidales bacterium]|nr:ketoacyl-ACP synthase III [Bacteroidales bacterium]
MKHVFHNKRISAIVCVLPDQVVRYEDELEDYPFPVRQSQMLGKMMDYNTRRQCAPTDSVSEYAIQGIQHLLDNAVIRTTEIDAIVVASSSQDYIMPSISYLLQGYFKLPETTYCCDIVQQCGGYQFGLMQSFMLMDTYGFRKVLLVTGEMTSKKVGLHDRNARPIIGDAVSVSILETADNGAIYTEYRNFGQMAAAIMIPAGGLKCPSTSETAIETKDEQGNYRALDHFYMDGEAVFNFVMTKVPPMLSNIMKDSGDTVDSIDYYMFHQPNKYMVDRLADELELPAEKYFGNIVGVYGNASTATIPLNICHNISTEATNRSLRLCLCGFGGGLTCNTIIFSNPPMDYCEIVDYKR